MNNPEIDRRWCTWPRPNPTARFRLFCFSYAGGGPAIFRAWPDRLPTTVEVCAIYLPGRGSRLNEPLYRQLPPLVEAVCEVILPSLDKPFAFFGHSMGALISFELARSLRRQRGPRPAHLFVSGRGAPHIPCPEPPIHALAEIEFVKALQRLNGTPKEVFEHPELMELLLPTLRADFTVCETYAYEGDAPLECALSAFGGLQDEQVSQAHLEAWSEQTRASFSLRMFRGDHFYLHESETLLLREIAKTCERLTHAFA